MLSEFLRKHVTRTRTDTKGMRHGCGLLACLLACCGGTSGCERKKGELDPNEREGEGALPGGFRVRARRETAFSSNDVAGLRGDFGLVLEVRGKASVRGPIFFGQFSR